jgi:ferredoxin-NADP reductase
MAGPSAAIAVGPWQHARVVAVRDETPSAKSFRLVLPEPVRFLPGQHFVLRLSAPDGYRAQRSYSVASPPAELPEIELTVERLENGEVSSFLHTQVVPGDELEVRGPIGGYFAWDGSTPALLVGGGSGVVPLMAMLRHARRSGIADRLRLVVSVRSPQELYYGGEIDGPETAVCYTRVAPPGSLRQPGRLASRDLAPLLLPEATLYICGSSGFADAVTELAADLGVTADRIRIERFGPTG